jgi:hypothetical protein
MAKRGIWYEAKYKRYRVRLYRYRKAFLAGYFKTEAEAEAALEALVVKIAAYTKEDILRMTGKIESKGVVGTFKDKVGAMKL